MVSELCTRIYGYMLWRKYRISYATNMKNTVQQRWKKTQTKQNGKRKINALGAIWSQVTHCSFFLPHVLPLYNDYIIFMYFIIPDGKKKNCINKKRILGIWGFIFDWINTEAMAFRGTSGGLMRLLGCPQTESCAVNSDAQDALGRKVKILLSSKPKSCKTHSKQNPSSVSI